MSLFRGQYYDMTPANHVFICNHPAMLYAGLSSFNLNTVGQFTKNPVLQKNIAIGFRKFGVPIVTPFKNQNGYSLLLNIVNSLELGSVGNASFDYEGYIGGKFVTQNITFSSLIDKILWYEDDYLPDPEKYEKDNPSGFKTNIKTIDGIKLCKKGYLELSRSPKIKTITTVPDNEDQISSATENVIWGEGGLDNIYIRCYVGSKSEFSSVRTIINKDPPVFVATPRRVTGGKYDASQTDGSNAGEYVDTQDSDEAAEGEQVAGTLGRVSYNSALGCYDIQNQITAVLLEDCDPASIPTPDVDNIDNLTSNQMYDSNNPNWQGDFTVCEAMPLSVEKGNPFIYGPNFIKCSDGTSVEKIIATNRSPKEFKKGQRVICHYVDNEWLLQEIGQPTPREPTATSVGRWSFAKFIANINQHFMPRDFDYFGTYDQSEGVEDTRIDITNMRLPMRTESLTEALVWQFWNKHGENYPEMVQTVEEVLDGRVKADWGTDPNSWKLNTGIIQTSIFDQYALRPGTGQTLYTRTNPLGALDVPYPEIAPLFFGPIFLEGYKKRLIPDSTISKYHKSNADYGHDTSIPLEASAVRGDLKAIRSEHLPAEVAINGPYQGSSSPVESYHAMAYHINDADYSFMALGSHYNYKYWETEGGEKQSFALPVVNPSKVQFIGLSMQFACADDVYAIKENMSLSYGGHSFRSSAQSIVLQNTVSDDTSSYSKVVAGLGAALDRGNPDIQTGPPAARRRQIYKSDADFSATQKCPKYNHYVDIRTGQGRDVLRTLSPSRLWVDSDGDVDPSIGSELVGIITARNKIVREGGGAVVITSIFNFGQGSSRTVSSTNSTFSWLGGNNFNITPGGVSTSSSSTWGDPEDRPQSFNVCNLHLKVYDYWPEDQTLFIAPYFTVLHFNPGQINTPAEKKTTYFLRQRDKDTGILYIDYSVEAGEESFNDFGYSIAVDIDVLTETTDFRVPTYADNPGILVTLEDGTEQIVSDALREDGDEVGGILYISENSLLRPERYWNVDTGRRGIMLTGSNFFDEEFGSYGGFIYGKKVIGLTAIGELQDQSRTRITENGTGFSEGEKYAIGSNGAVIEVKEVNDDGGITSFEFAESTDDQNLVNNEATYRQRGEGYLPSDFPLSVVVAPPDGGTACEITFSSGKGYNKNEYDTSPRSHIAAGNGKKLSPAGANEGTSQITGAQSFTISLPDNSSYSSYPGQYEFFYYFQNDIGIATEDNTTAFDMNNNIQTIGVDIV